MRNNPHWGIYFWNRYEYLKPLTLWVKLGPLFIYFVESTGTFRMTLANLQLYQTIVKSFQTDSIFAD